MNYILSLSILLFTTLMYSNYTEDLNSKSHILIDFTTGKILSEKSSNEVMAPASLTKIMTAYVVLSEVKNGNIKKDDYVKISKNAVLTARKTNSARTFLEVPHKVTVHEVLKGLIVQSGNDAAISLAEHVSGTESDFSALMNDYAKKLNMNNSNFKNASGLPEKEHYTTAYDLSLMIRDLIKQFPEDYAYYFSMKGYTYNNIYQPNRNRMLFRDEEFDGIKTGWTNEAGYCYAASLIREGRRLVIVTLNADNSEARFNDSLKLADYGYNNFENVILTSKNEPISGLEQIPIYKSDLAKTDIIIKDELVLTIKKGDKKNIKAKVNIDPYVIAPVNKNEKVGDIAFFINDNKIAETDIVIKDQVLLGNWKNVLVDHIALNL